MKFSLQTKKFDRTSGNTWIDPGIYEFVRIFDTDRYLINTSPKVTSWEKRQLTVVKKTDGVLLT